MNGNSLIYDVVGRHFAHIPEGCAFVEALASSDTTRLAQVCSEIEWTTPGLEQTWTAAFVAASADLERQSMLRSYADVLPPKVMGDLDEHLRSQRTQLGLLSPDRLFEVDPAALDAMRAEVADRLYALDDPRAWAENVLRTAGYLR